MADAYVGFDPDAPAGSKFPDEVIDEIQRISPSIIAPNSVGSTALIDSAVSTPKIAGNAVTTPKINDSAVTTPKLGPNAVTTAKINDAAVTGAKTGTGVMRLRDYLGNFLNGDVVFLTAAQYAALGTPDPNTVYLIA